MELQTFDISDNPQIGEECVPMIWKMLKDRDVEMEYIDISGCSIPDEGISKLMRARIQ